MPTSADRGRRVRPTDANLLRCQLALLPACHAACHNDDDRHEHNHGQRDHRNHDDRHFPHTLSPSCFTLPPCPTSSPPAVLAPPPPRCPPRPSVASLHTPPLTVGLLTSIPADRAAPPRFGRPKAGQAGGLAGRPAEPADPSAPTATTLLASLSLYIYIYT